MKTHPTRLTLLTREQALSLDQNLQINSTGFADQVNSVCSLLGTNYFEEQADELKYNNLYVGGPWVSYDTAFNISKGISTSSTKKLAASKFQNLPKPISLKPAQQHQLSVSFTDDQTVLEGLRSEYNNSRKLVGSEFVNSIFVKRFVNDLCFQVQSAIKCTTSQTFYELEENSFFHACMSYPKTKDCQFFKILIQPTPARKLCDNCVADFKNQKRCTRRKSIDAGDRENISSHVPTSTMSPNLVNKRLKLRRNKLNAKIKQVKRLQLKLEFKEPMETQMVSLDDENMRGVVTAAYDHIGKIKDSELTSDMIKILVASEMKDSAVATKLYDTEMEYLKKKKSW